MLIPALQATDSKPSAVQSSEQLLADALVLARKRTGETTNFNLRHGTASSQILTNNVIIPTSLALLPDSESLKSRVFLNNAHPAWKQLTIQFRELEEQAEMNSPHFISSYPNTVLCISPNLQTQASHRHPLSNIYRMPYE